jgi:hypothetical protein
MKTRMTVPALLALLVATGGAAPTLASEVVAPLTPLAPAAGAEARPDQLPIRSIALYRSGVASFQRRGQIDGSRTVQLRFDVNQINDILKSMVVLDLSGQGRVGGVGYASRDPLAKRLASFGVDISDEPSLSTLLTRLRGAQVAITVPDGTCTGTVIGGEVRPMTFGSSPTPVQIPFLNVLTAGGIRSLNLTLASNVEVLDKELATELQRALAAVAEHRADRTKTVDVSFIGDGAREVMIGYVQEAPVWKASYRLVLPEANAAAAAAGEKADAARMKDKVSMQGWAIIENTTDEDWNGIDLSLVSGQPVSFRMDLYQPLYATRPLVPVPTVSGVAPRVFEGGIAGKPAAPAPAKTGGSSLRRGTGGGGEGGEKYKDAAGRPPAPAMADSDAALIALASSGPDIINYSDSQATAAEAGEIFEYRLNHPVTVERQRSAMLPIIADALSGRRVSICASNDSGSHPMRGIELHNDTGLQLLPGPIAVYEGATYAGDAQIGHVPAGDTRLLAYSVDLEVEVQRSGDQTSAIQQLRLVKGGLEMTSLTRLTSKYVFANKDAKRPRTVIVEQMKMGDWQLKEPKTPYETTDRVYRFALDLASGKSGELAVVQEHIDAQQLDLVGTGIDALLRYRAQGAKVSDAVLEAARKAASLNDAVHAVEARIAERTKEKSEIDADQGRIRQNMSTIDRASPLYAKYLQKLTEQETRVDAIGDELRKAAAELNAAREALSAFVSNLNAE